MRKSPNPITLAALLGVAFTTQLHAKSAAFSYHGSLSDNGSPASDIYDLRFAIYDNPSAGAQQGDGITNTAFNVGEDERHISTVDFGGVALAAIQGLNQKLTEELKRRDAENAEMKQELAKLKQLVGSLADTLNGGAK